MVCKIIEHNSYIYLYEKSLNILTVQRLFKLKQLMYLCNHDFVITFNELSFPTFISYMVDLTIDSWTRGVYSLGAQDRTSLINFPRFNSVFGIVI